MDRLLGVKEMAEILGVKRSTLYSWVYTRKIPFIKVGRLVKFDLNDVREWLNRSKVKPWNDNRKIEW